MTEPWQPDEAMAAFIELDHDRARRRGYPEAVYCEGKTPGQVSAVAETSAASRRPTGCLAHSIEGPTKSAGRLYRET